MFPFYNIISFLGSSCLLTRRFYCDPLRVITLPLSAPYAFSRAHLRFPSVTSLICDSFKISIF